MTLTSRRNVLFYINIVEQIFHRSRQTAGSFSLKRPVPSRYEKQKRKTYNYPWKKSDTARHNIHSHTVSGKLFIYSLQVMTESRPKKHEERMEKTAGQDLMKIAQISPYFYPHIGGVETHVHELSRELGIRGHDVHIYTSKFLKRLDEKEEFHHYTVHRIKPLVSLFTTPVMPKMKKALVEQGFDILHVHSPPPVSEYYTLKAAQQLGVPFVLTYHCDLEVPGFIGRAVVNTYLTTLAKTAINKADAIIATSRSYQETSRMLWNKRGIIAPNAVNPERFTPENDGSRIKKKLGLEDKFIVLYVGRLVPHKGIESLVYSSRRTPDDIHYIVIGVGPHENHLKKLVAHLKLEKKVTFLKDIPHEELPLYYAFSNVFVLPSLSRLEAFGIVGLEAMATGLPVILSGIPGVMEVIQEGKQGFLSEPSDAQSIADRIMTLYEDPKLREEMGKEGRKLVLEKYQWKSVADTIEKLFLELVETKAGGDEQSS